MGLSLSPDSSRMCISISLRSSIFVAMAILALIFLASSVVAQKCASSLQSSTGAPIVASGYTANVFANRLSGPRGMIVDSAGNLLVVEKGRGISAFKLNEEGACVSAGAKSTVVGDPSVSASHVA